MQCQNSNHTKSVPYPCLAMGTWALAGEAPWGYGPCKKGVAEAAIDTALDLGVLHFDTAALFGNGAVETLLGKRLPTHAHVTTRVGCRVDNGHPVGDFSGRFLADQVAQCGKRLKRSRIDTVLLHTPSIGVLRDGQAMGALLDLKAAGAIGTVGASVFDPEEGQLALNSGADWVCIPYNPLNRKAEASLFASAHQAGARVQVREVLHNGRLTQQPRPMTGLSEFDVRKEWPDYLHQRLAMGAQIIGDTLPDMTRECACIGYALGHPQVDSVVIGCRSADQVRASFATPAAITQAHRQRLNAALYGND